MIGYYVHHHGTGHVHRAVAIASALQDSVTGISSLPRPTSWLGPWIELPRDDAEDIETIDVDGHGRLHWVPEYHSGLRARMSIISSWINDFDPELMIIDVSVEVALLTRLHGVPFVTLVLPGERHDPAHQLVHTLARRCIAAWPAAARQMVLGVDEHSERFFCVGGISRFDSRGIRERPSIDGPRRVVVLTGSGGIDITSQQIDAARLQTPGWEWVVLGEAGMWVEDPWDWLTSAHVVVTHAGQNAIAEIAAARRPAIILPQTRPFDEQKSAAASLKNFGRYPARVLDNFSAHGWSDLLDSVSRLNGEDWEAWNDLKGIARAVAVIEAELPPVREMVSL